MPPDCLGEQIDLMHLSAIELINYKRHERFNVELEPGVNLVFGPNESGKSTLFDAVVDVLGGTSAPKFADRRTIGADDDPIVRLVTDVDGQTVVLERHGPDRRQSVIIDGERQQLRGFLERLLGSAHAPTVAQLLMIRERALELKAGSEGFKQIFDDVLKIRDIVDAAAGIGSAVGRGGLKGKVGREVDAIRDRHRAFAERLERMESRAARDAADVAALAAARERRDRHHDALVDLRESGRQLEVMTRAAQADESEAHSAALDAERSRLTTEARSLDEHDHKLGAERATIGERLATLHDASRQSAMIVGRSEPATAAADRARSAVENLEGQARRREEIRRLLKGLPEATVEQRRRLLADVELLESSDVASLAFDVTGSGQVAVDGVVGVDRPWRGEGGSVLRIEVGDAMIEVGAGRELLEKAGRVREELEHYPSRLALEQALLLDEELEKLAPPAALVAARADLRDAEAALGKAQAAGRKLEAINAEMATFSDRLESLEAKRAEVTQLRENNVAARARLDAEIVERPSPKDAQAARYARDELPHGVVVHYAGASVADLEAATQAARDDLEAGEVALGAVQREIEIGEATTRDAPDNDALEELRHRTYAVERQVDRARHWEQVLGVAQTLTAELARRLESDYLEETMHGASERFRELTDGSYRRLSLSVPTLFSNQIVDSLRAFRDDLKEFTFEELSDGTRVIAALSLRLALIERLDTARPLFLLVDEPFAYIDDVREAHTWRSFARLAAAGWQLIIATCRQPHTLVGVPSTVHGINLGD